VNAKQDTQGTTRPQHQIRRATAGDAAAMSSVLARAFATNPFVRWILPDDDHYARIGDSFFRMAVEQELAHGEVYTDDAIGGAALWLPPGSPSPGLVDQLRMGLQLLKVAGTRTLVAAPALMKFETARPTRPHWYLTVLGTAPSVQGQGLGGALIDPILKRCDESGVPAYLESSNPDNVSYYQRFDFEVTGEVAYRGGPTVPLMLREPRK
jgi:ribosomal protein S18 acetylase RimI-like enzyme